MFETLDRAEERLADFHLDALYIERDAAMDAKQALIDALVVTLEYYAHRSIYNDIRVGDKSIYVDMGQRARNTLELYEEYKDAAEIDGADAAELEQAHKGWIGDLNLPKDFKFIEMRKEQDEPIKGE